VRRLAAVIGVRLLVIYLSFLRFCRVFCYVLCTATKLVMPTNGISDLFQRMVLLFGVLYCVIWLTFTMLTTPQSREIPRDVILACRSSYSLCTLDRSVRDTVTQLKIRRRGCRAGAHCRQRRLAAMTSSGCSTDQAD